MASRGTQREPTGEERAAQLRASREIAAQLGHPRNEPVLKNEGQALSKKQTADLERAVEQAMLWCRNHGGAKYEDPDFPPSARAIYGADRPDAFVEMPQAGEVAPVWKRPSEFMPEPPMLLKVPWQVENIRQGAVNDRWLISAINIVSSNTEQLMRAFLDPTKASAGGRVGAKEESNVHSFGQQYGFYVCRFFHDDPLSDDDWAVVLIDDRLPLSALTGRPCFASHPDPSVYWGMLLEKAAAKFAGSYSQLRGGTVVQGLKLLTGGRVPSPPRLNTPEGRALIPPSPTPFALWHLIMDKVATNHVVGAAHAAKEHSPSAPLAPDAAAAIEEAERMGLVARRAYAVIACGEAMGHKLLKLRLPLAPEPEAAARAAAGRPTEWIGRFSDESDDWRPQLRQMLSYSRDASDSTFWILYEDFCTHFNKVYFCRMADDIWTKLVVQSRWLAGESAGGPPDTLAFRHNYQWLVKVESRPVRLVVTLSQTDARRTGGNGRGYASAIGLVVALGNGGDDRQRRRLVVPPGETVAAFPAKFAQQVTLEVTLPPDPARPYVLVPFLHAPGLEGAFKLTVRADDADDDGVADFTMAAVAEPDDWQCSVLQGAWVEGTSAAGGPHGAAAWLANPQYGLRLAGGGRARVYAFVELMSEEGAGAGGAGDDGAASGGAHGAGRARAEPVALGLVAAAGTADGALLDGPPQVLREVLPRRADAVYVEFEISSSEGNGSANGGYGHGGGGDEEGSAPVVLVPYLETAGVGGRFQISVYTSGPHTFELLEPGRSGAGAADAQACEFCHAPALIYEVLNKVAAIEAKTERLRLLEAQFVARGIECYANRDADCGPGWDLFNQQKAELERLTSGRSGYPNGHGGGGGGATASDAAYLRALSSLGAEARARLADCPDIDVDLSSMRIALRRMLSFQPGLPHFVSEHDEGVLVQLARALSLVNALLFERGVPPLTALIEGFSSSNAPCLLPCCARYQGQPEGAPNCALARARAFACKQRLVPLLVSLDSTGQLAHVNAAAATVLTAGYRFSRSNALPGFDDGANYRQNRRVEIRVLAPDEGRAARAAQEPEVEEALGGALWQHGAQDGEEAEMMRRWQQEQAAQQQAQQQQHGMADALLELQQHLAPESAPSGRRRSSTRSGRRASSKLTPLGPPSSPLGPIDSGRSARGQIEEEAALHAVLASLHADLLTLIGETCEQVDTSELPNGRIRLRWALLYRGDSALFADAEAADAALSQAAHVISALNRLLREYARPPLLSCVYVFPPEYDVAGSNLHAKVAIARAEACAVLLCARLAVADGEAEADVRTRTLPLGAPEIVPPPLFEGGPPDAKAAVLDIVFVGPVRFEQLISERAAAEALEDAENERLQAIENEKAAAIEVALAAEREALAAEAEREKAKAVRAAIKAERARIEAENRTAANGGRTQNPQSKACSVQ